MTRAVNLASAGSIVSESVGTAPGYMARAWVNFNGTGTVAIRASGNVSSITDNGVGDYTVNFTTAMSDANYSCVMAQNFGEIGVQSYNTGSVRVFAASSAGTLNDASLMSVSIFR